MHSKSNLPCSVFIYFTSSYKLTIFYEFFDFICCSTRKILCNTKNTHTTHVHGNLYVYWQLHGGLTCDVVVQQ